MSSFEHFKTWKPFDKRYNFQPYSGTPQHSYLIASTRRSGSYFLSYLLQATGQLGAPLEYLHPEHAETWQRRLGASDFASTLRELFKRRTSPNGWFGIKAHWDHFEFGRQSGLDDLIKFERFIRIERRDKIAQAVSLAMARQTKSWLSMQEKLGEPDYRESEITRALAHLERQSKAWDSWATSSRVRPLYVYYEDLLTKPLEVLNGILREFGLTEIDELPEVPTSKQASALNTEWKRRYLAPAARFRRSLKLNAKRLIGRS